MKLSVVIPSYNEEANLKKGVLKWVEDCLKKSKLDYEVIVVDDGSTDQTSKLTGNFIKNKKNWKILSLPHGGKANAVLNGMEASSGEIVLFTDMDQATPMSELEKFLPKFNEGFDIVIGLRSGRKGAPFVRKISAWGFSVLRALILGLPFKDTQCGFKAFSKNSVEKIIPKIKNEWGTLHFKGGAVNAGFDVELLYLAKKYGFKIAEIGVEWRYVDTERVQVIKDAAAAVYDMLRIRWNDISGKYE